MTRRQSNPFAPSAAETRRITRQRRAMDRANARLRKQQLKRQQREQMRQRRGQSRLESKWKKEERKRRLADDKRIRKDRRRWQKQAKRQALGLGSGGGGRGSAAGMRTAKNLLTLANQIGVRFTRDDQAELIAYAEQQMSGSGDDVYSLYQQLTSGTFIGRRTLAVVGEYSPQDVESGNSNQNDNMLVARVQAVGEMLGAWSNTNSVQDANALGVVITNVLGATPEAIKEDQRKYERELGEAQYLDTLEKYQGKSQVWQAVHYWLHPEDRPENARAIAMAELDREIRQDDTSDARAQEALAGTGESNAVVNDNPLGNFISNVRRGLGL